MKGTLPGHRMLSTLHTNSAAGAIPRLLDMKLEPFLISSTLSVIVAQRLVRKLCEEKEQYTLSASDVKNLAEHCNLERVEKLLQELKLLKSKQQLKSLDRKSTRLNSSH